VPKVETSLDPCQIPAISEAVIGGVEAKAESWMAHPPIWPPFQLWEATKWTCTEEHDLLC
jgi:hypothetical protein